MVSNSYCERFCVVWYGLISFFLSVILASLYKLSILFMISFAVIVAVSGSGNKGGLTLNLSVLFNGMHEIFVHEFKQFILNFFKCFWHWWRNRCYRAVTINHLFLIFPYFDR